MTEDEPTHEIVSLNRMPSDEAIEEMCRRYFDREASGYDPFDQAIDKRRLYHQAIDKVVFSHVSALDTCDVIISFGCGTGRREADLRGKLRPPPAVIGIETSAQMAAHASARGVDVARQADIPSAVADAVLCLYSFVHLPSVYARRKLLTDAHRWLRPSGLLIIDVFNLHDRFEWGANLGTGSKPRGNASVPSSGGDVFYRRIGHSDVAYMHYFSLAEISGLLEDAGFVVIQVVGVGYGRHAGRVGVPLDEGCLLLTCVKR